MLHVVIDHYVQSLILQKVILTCKQTVMHGWICAAIRSGKYPQMEIPNAVSKWLDKVSNSCVYF